MKKMEKIFIVIGKFKESITMFLNIEIDSWKIIQCLQGRKGGGQEFVHKFKAP